MIKGIAGTTESSDCLITVEPNEGIEVIVESIVKDFFGDHIENLIKQTLKELKVKNIKVVVDDKGAYDFTIKARLLTAIERMES
ncbi:MAG: citrate lyase acyl carrier protein [Acholeplasmataceae bacterium]